MRQGKRGSLSKGVSAIKLVSETVLHNKTMMEIKTNRLVLNSFSRNEANRVAELAGNKSISDLTSSLPYPYQLIDAEKWISTHQYEKIENKNYIFGIRLIDDQNLIGCINIGLNESHKRGYLGFWIGEDFWGHGYATEAVRALVKWGFQIHGVHKIWAEHFPFNIASERVLEKCGFIHEGVKREHFKKSERFLDLAVKSILRSEFTDNHKDQLR